MSKLEQIEGDARDSIVALLSDLSIRKLSAYIWYSSVDKKQALRALGSAVSFLDSAVLASVSLDDNKTIRQEYLRIKNFVINNCEEFSNISEHIDSLSHIYYYIKNDEHLKQGVAESLVEYW